MNFTFSKNLFGGHNAYLEADCGVIYLISFDGYGNVRSYVA